MKKKKKSRSQFDIRRGQPLTLFFPRQNQPTFYASLFLLSSESVEVEINRLYAHDSIISYCTIIID